MFIFRSRVGTFWIRTDQCGRCVLGIDNDALGNYSSPLHAADNVYTHTTGYSPWDSLDGKILDAPTDIYEWERQP